MSEGTERVRCLAGWRTGGTPQLGHTNTSSLPEINGNALYCPGNSCLRGLEKSLFSSLFFFLFFFLMPSASNSRGRAAADVDEGSRLFIEMFFCSNHSHLQFILLKDNYTRSCERKKALSWACDTETENYFIVVTAPAN